MSQDENRISDLIDGGLINEKETMNAKKYLLDIGFDDAHLPDLFNEYDKSYYKIIELMEDYHRVKLEAFNKAKHFCECGEEATINICDLCCDKMVREGC